MPHVYHSHTAEHDLDQIWDYIARDSITAADRFLDRIGSRCEELAVHPLSGPARDDLGTGVRDWPVGNYIIYYRPVDDGIEVVRVVHGARDIDSSHFQ